MPYRRLRAATDGIWTGVQDWCYAQNGGDEGTPIPLSLMLLGSYSNTTKGQAAPAANNYGPNGSFAMDQISLFAGGCVTDYAGAFVQGT